MILTSKSSISCKIAKSPALLRGLLFGPRWREKQGIIHTRGRLPRRRGTAGVPPSRTTTSMRSTCRKARWMPRRRTSLTPKWRAIIVRTLGSMMETAEAGTTEEVEEVDTETRERATTPTPRTWKTMKHLAEMVCVACPFNMHSLSLSYPHSSICLLTSPSNWNLSTFFLFFLCALNDALRHHCFFNHSSSPNDDNWA